MSNYIYIFIYTHTLPEDLCDAILLHKLSGYDPTLHCK